MAASLAMFSGGLWGATLISGGEALAGGTTPPPPCPTCDSTTAPVSTPTTSSSTSSPTTTHRHRDTTPPPRVGHLADHTHVAGRIRLTWTIAKPTDVAQVLVRRGPAGACPTSSSAGIPIGGTEPRRRQDDTTEHDKTAYCYAVFTADKHGNVSPAAIAPRVLNKGLPPKPARDLSVHVGASGKVVRVAWKNPATGVDHVVVARGLADACPVRPSQGVKIRPITRAQAVDATATPGTGYCYSVFVVDRVGNVSRPTHQPFTVPAPAQSASADASPATPAPQAAPSNSGISRIVRGVGGGALLLAALAYLGFRRIRRESRWQTRTGYTLRDAARLDLRAYDPAALVIPAVVAAGVVCAIVLLVLSS